MYQDNSCWAMIQSASTRWTRYEDKLFEQALVRFSEDLPDRWEKIAQQLPGRSPSDVMEHYEALVHDVFEIDSGRVQLPSYADDSFGLSRWDSASQISFGSKPKQQGGEPERKKGTPWTEEEHRKFLLGLQQFGKGDWRSISRNVVITRTPTQVASHAQKYFLRQNSVKKERKRSSIHDITSAETNSVPMSADQNWIPPPGGQPLPLQQLPPTGHMPDQGASLGYQNFSFPM
ncbi:transcription factor DIVARICATA [Ziziphus jujuba]|uniref:Transcription factor DIVARICATA n=2 Tax=Ziziphus jujuba TaxID=326968 RepID=A0ABM3IEI2_ZIZJJ|nr:transcription factor DIVARICATA [Ziziphus jujuba]KAH7536914.1 hypothetical protein FEM48_Zijuj03G0036900 [Ziziphus jujuba var. spinosa]